MTVHTRIYHYRSHFALIATQGYVVYHCSLFIFVLIFPLNPPSAILCMLLKVLRTMKFFGHSFSRFLCWTVSYCGTIK